MRAPASIRLSRVVQQARSANRPIVVLESSVLAQGLPIPANREAGRRMLKAVAEHGATPAISAIVRGSMVLGLDGDDLERFLQRSGIRKVSSRDLGFAIATGVDGGTTAKG